MRQLAICCGVLAVFVGLGFVCPQVAHLRECGVLGFNLALLLLGGVLTFIGGGAAIVGVAMPRLFTRS